MFSSLSLSLITVTLIIVIDDTNLTKKMKHAKSGTLKGKEDEPIEIESEIDQNSGSSSSDSDDEEITSSEIKSAVHLASNAIFSNFDWKNKPNKTSNTKNSTVNKNDVSPSKPTLAKNTSNALSDLIPGYIAPMKLNSSALDPYRPSNSINKIDPKNSSIQMISSLPKSKTSQHTRNLHAAATGTGNAGPKWFNMASTPLTSEVEADIRIIANRNYLDPKRFYKSSDISHLLKKKKNQKKSPVFQMGTVVEGMGEYYSNRLHRKNRKQNLTEELMNDSSITQYAKKQYLKISAMNEQKGKKKIHRKGQRNKF